MQTEDKWLRIIFIIIFALMFSQLLYGAVFANKSISQRLNTYNDPNHVQTTHYVSSAATGDNTGESWADAWEELDQINWSQVEPSDLILLDGGAMSMTQMAIVMET